jgi:hypothetical protein
VFSDAHSQAAALVLELDDGGAILGFGSRGPNVVLRQYRVK